MLAIDTNLVIRYLTGDHPAQARKAREIIDHETVFVSTTVLLESEWVLRGVFDMKMPAVAQALINFLGLRNVVIEDAALAAKGLDWMRKGMDFADALHLAKAEGCEAFVSFDRRLGKAARPLSKIGVDLI